MIHTGVMATNDYPTHPEILVREATGEVGLLAGGKAIYFRADEAEKIAEAILRAASKERERRRE
jgi:hypothetical protein